MQPNIWKSLSQKTCLSLLCPALTVAFPPRRRPAAVMNISRLILHRVPQECYTALLVLLFLQVCPALVPSPWLPPQNLDCPLFPFFWLVEILCNLQVSASLLPLLRSRFQLQIAAPVCLPKFYICKYTSFPLFYPSFSLPNWIPYSCLNSNTT